MGTENTHRVESSPENVDWGAFDPDRDPVLEVSPGATVEIETVTPPRPAHRETLTSAGVDPDDILADEIAVAETVSHMGPGPHVVTGPVAIEGATPGDVLEIEVVDVDLRAPYGINLFSPGGGELPERFPYEAVEVVPFDLEAGVAAFADGVELPLDPFLGIMAVSPPPSEGRTDTAPPDYFGGNLDLRRLGAGSTLYLPVHAEDALFWAGDGHGMQGDGEVCLTATETSVTATLTFELHTGTGRLDWPVAETDDHYIVMGLNESLDDGVTHALRQCIRLLSDQTALSEADAYRLASLAVDFTVTQVVNGTKGVHGLIPKAIFTGDGDIDPTMLE
jgi:acetamidase/formamidase